MTEEEIQEYLASRRSYYVRIAQRRTIQDDVEDMVQEAMLEVAKALRATPGKPDTYYNKVAAYRVATLINEHRLWTGMPRGRGGHPVDPLRDGLHGSLDKETEEGLDLYGLFGADEVGYEVAEAKASMGPVLAAVAALPTQQRRVAIGVAEGRTKQEIADEMGLSYGTVRSYWNEWALPRLRGELAGFYDEWRNAA